jgi:hypothetical protein
MKRQWHTRRHLREASDGRARWDHAYQLLLRWGEARERRDAIAAAELPAQEVTDALLDLRSSFHPTPSPESEL